MKKKPNTFSGGGVSHVKAPLSLAKTIAYCSESLSFACRNSAWDLFLRPSLTDILFGPRADPSFSVKTQLARLRLS